MESRQTRDSPLLFHPLCPIYKASPYKWHIFSFISLTPLTFPSLEPNTHITKPFILAPCSFTVSVSQGSLQEKKIWPQEFELATHSESGFSFPQWWGSVTYSKHVSLGPSFTRTVRATPMEGKRNRVVRRNRWNPMQSSQQPHLAHGNSSELIQVGESSRTIICPHWESLDTDHPWDKAWHWVRQFSSADATVRRTESTIF